MENQLYVRIRGRVQGPFDTEKLRALVRRGQLSRMHEVSNDGNDWKQASEYSELFATATKQTNVEPETVSEDVQATVQEAAWYYSANGVQSGPVTFEQLQAQASPGHLSTDDLVWKEGMKEWVPGSSIPGLMFGAASSGVEENTQSTPASSKLGSGLIRTLKDSQSWIRFIAFFLFMSFFFALVAGLYFIAIGIHGHVGAVVGAGVFGLLYAAIFFYAGWLVHTYRKRVERVLQDRSQARLDAALQSLRTLWIFVSIVLIVLLVNVIAAAVTVFSGYVFDGSVFR